MTEPEDNKTPKTPKTPARNASQSDAGGQTPENIELSSEECPHCLEYKAGWQRAVADYQNLQKETAGKRGEWAEWSAAEIIREFIPVYENFRKAFSLEPGTWNPEQKNWKQGVEYIMKQFGEVLKSYGVEEIKTVGERFDLALHEIVGEEDAGVEEGTIVKEVEGGYRKNGRVIKVAKVVVAKNNETK